MFGEQPREELTKEEELNLYKERAEDRLRALPEEIGDKIRKQGIELQLVLGAYMIRPDSDPEILSLMSELIDKIEHSTQYGSSQSGLSTERTNNLKAGLLGVVKVLTPDALINTEVESEDSKKAKERVGLAALFLDLVQEKIGTLDKKTGKSEIKMRVAKDQSRGSTIKYSSK